MMKQTIEAAIIQQLAAENRRVLIDWRALILLRRATFATLPAHRRWLALPRDVTDIRPVLRQMARRASLQPLIPGRYCYRVALPYAHQYPIENGEILGELNPYAALSHQSALVYHGLTDDLPTIITMLLARDGLGDLVPPGTTSEDWEDVARPPSGQPNSVGKHPVRWTTTKRSRFFGVELYHRHGYPQRVTDRERTLLDALLDPELAGGIQNVLVAWARARDLLAIEKVIEYTERFESALMRQRVGFLLDELRLSHAAIERWREQAQRHGHGGSSKLVASAPYGEHYSETWQLALNAPLGPLRNILA
jgi:predicted transcriptional regulator of viral defense system